MDGWKNNITFILIDTLEAGNIGASARALKNLGFSRFELVRPREFPSDKAGWFAHGAPENTSFNLTQAVLIVAYELSYTDYASSPPPVIISNQELSPLFQRLRKTIRTTGYAPKGIRDDDEQIMRDLRRVLAKAAITIGCLEL